MAQSPPLSAKPNDKLANTYITAAMPCGVYEPNPTKAMPAYAEPNRPSRFGKVVCILADHAEMTINATPVMITVVDAHASPTGIIPKFRRTKP